MHMGSEYDDNLFRSDSSHEDTMGRITSRKIEVPPPSIQPPKVRRFSIAAKGRKVVCLEPGESVTIGRDILVKNTDSRRAEILLVVPLSVTVSDQEIVCLVE
jgi:hypothetical protein